MLIGLGVLINYVLSSFIGVEKPNLFPILKVIGVLVNFNCINSFSLSLVKEKVSLIIKSTLVALLGLVGTAYFSAEALVLLLKKWI